MKFQTKKSMAADRRERFMTGGGVPTLSLSSTSSVGDLAGSLLTNQQPLEGINDDDHIGSGRYYHIKLLGLLSLPNLNLATYFSNACENLQVS